VVVLGIVGTWVLLDAWKLYRSGTTHEKNGLTRLAKWVHTLRIPRTMFYCKSAKAHISWLVTVPIGFATGMLAATIAVGGFIAVRPCTISRRCPR